MLMVPLLCLALGVFAAICSYSFGAGKGAGILFVVLILAGVFLSFSSPNAFQFYLMLVGYGAALVIVAGGLGLAVGVNLKRKRYWLSVLLFLPFPYLIWNTQTTTSTQANEQGLALEYVKNNKQVTELAGGPFKTYRASATTYASDNSRGRYEFDIVGSNSFKAIVDVSRKSGETKFSLTCATKLSMGERNALKDICMQTTIPLSK